MVSVMRSDVSPNGGATAHPVRSGGVRQAHWATLLLLFAAALAFRFACLACKPFWFDECFSVEVTRMKWPSFLHVLWWREANMALYYGLLRLWLHFGWSAFFIRSLSALIAAATLPAIYWLAGLLFSERDNGRLVALIATALFAINAFHVRYAQEARSYALLVLLATLSSGFLVAAVREPRRPLGFKYMLTSVLAAYAHLYALLLIVAQWLTVWRLGLPPGNANESRKTELKRAWKVIGIAVFPLVVFVAKTGTGPIRWIHRPTLHDVLAFLEHFCGSDHWPLLLLYSAACVAAVAPFSKRLLARDQSWDTWRCQFLLIWLFFPVLLTLLLSLAKPVFYDRYLIFCLPPLTILAAAGLARLRPAWLIAPCLAAFLLLSLQGVFFVYSHDFGDERDAAGAASDFILDHSQPGDGIIFHIPQIRVPYEFFRSLRTGGNLSAAAQIGPEIVYPHSSEEGLDFRDFKARLSADFLGRAVPSHRRVWVVLMYNGPKLPDPTAVLLTKALPEWFPHVQRWQFPKVEVRLYSRE